MVSMRRELIVIGTLISGAISLLLGQISAVAAAVAEFLLITGGTTAVFTGITIIACAIRFLVTFFTFHMYVPPCYNFTIAAV